MLHVNKWKLCNLPLKQDVESKRVLKRLPRAHAALAELKGIASSIPNQSILINTIALQEAKDSSEIENIVTTHDELYKSELDLITSMESKEVQNYVRGIKVGYDLLKSQGLLTNKTILRIHEEIEQNRAGFRKVPGTTLKNSRTSEVVYTPPQESKEITDYMANLELYINDDGLSDLDPIVKMAIVHFQFESIHPFYDGNGRTGRILNILYLVYKDLLEIPILFLSNYITRQKSRYYELLQGVRRTNNYEEWLLYMIDAVDVTSRQTIDQIKQIRDLMLEMKVVLRSKYKFYSQDLLNNLFKYPYTKIEYLVRDLGVSRLTAANYLNKLSDDGLLQKNRLGKSNYYVNYRLFELLKKK